jgi:hypothetical protein
MNFRVHFLTPKSSFIKKKKYDTSVVMLYLLGKEKLLPEEFRKTIPYSTISSWRKTAYEKYEGSQFRFLFDDNWDIIRLKHENQKFRNTLRSLSRSYFLLKSDLSDFIKTQKNKKEFQNKVVLAVNELRRYIGLEATLKIFFLHRNQFYEMAVASRHSCTFSFSSQCLRRYPRQLQQKEVERIKFMLTSPKYEHWPIVSVAAHALRNKQVMAGLYSWYKYARILNLSHKACKKTTKQVGLIAQKPNEYLHIDTTYYHIADTKKVCITIVMDNFSRMILGFAVEDQLSFDLIKSAIKNALPPLLHHEGERHSFLVSDGGKENNNSRINEFISSISEHRLKKLTALKDIQFSNSPVEAIHKIIKGRYLRNRKFETLQALTNFLKEAIHDYNYLRPHYKHYPKTPAEAYFKTDLKMDCNCHMAKAMKARIRTNLATSCCICRQEPIKKTPASFPFPSPSLSPTYDIS